METKVCRCCGRELPLTGFYKHNMTKDGYHNTCKACFDAARRGIRVSKGEMTPILSITDFEDNQLFTELRRRGYTGELHYSKVIAV